MENKKKILLVDDDITSLDIMAVLFERRGFEVSRKASGSQAIDSLKFEEADIAVVDLMMPVMDGVETVNNLRSQGFTKPVLAFTASNDEDLHQRAMDAGCTSVITKPCKADKIVEIISSCL